MCFKDLTIGKYVANVRLSSNEILIKEGRCTNPKPSIEIRLQMCNFNEVEHEKHFLLKCLRYHLFRMRFFANILYLDVKGLVGNIDHVCINIMVSKNENLTFSLGKLYKDVLNLGRRKRLSIFMFYNNNNVLCLQCTYKIGEVLYMLQSK